ncbi:MAG: porin family protein [Gammaproteobacteria bacterium]|nr:porin family protein [Gammaproteobacteria bacterium]MDH4316587.1 porin family protein [Gammaproteobacteria bacterium]
MNRFVSFMLLMFLSTAGAAEGLNYNFVEVGYAKVDIDSPDVDGDGFGIGGSFAISDEFHLFGNYQMADFDFNVDLTQFDVGIGFNTPIADAIDVVASLAYVYTEVEASGFGSVDDNGFGLGVGLRALVSPQVELHGGVTYVDLSDSGSDTALDAGFRFNFNERFALGLAASWGDDVSIYSLAGRIYF